MNNENNILSRADEAKIPAEGKRPPLFAAVIAALALAASAILLPEIGYFAMILMSAFGIYLVSARSPIPVLFIPVLGFAAVYLRGGILLLGIAVAITATAYITGATLRLGGDFHRALMTYTFVTLAVSVAAAAVYTGMHGITAQEISDAVAEYVHDAMSQMINAFGDSISLDTAELLTEQYETVAKTAVFYIPAVAAWCFQICGIIALRFTGLLHDLTASTLYPAKKRIALLNRTFSLIFLITLLIGSMDAGIVGVCCANIAMIFLLPAAMTGISVYKGKILHRRFSGKRGLPPSFTLLILVFILFSPVLGIVILALTGAFSPFGKITVIYKKDNR